MRQKRSRNEKLPTVLQLGEHYRKPYYNFNTDYIKNFSKQNEIKRSFFIRISQTSAGIQRKSCGK
jgi:hypothetical protein